MEELLQQILQECRPYTGQGALASYIPELARQDPDRLGIAVFHKDGNLVEAGDSRRCFTIQSVMKPLLLLLALQDNGRETVRAHVGVEATGKPFDAINVADNALLAKHLNPMVNAGAILMCQLVGGETYDQRFARLLGFIRRLAANEKIDLDEEVYHSEKATGSKNRALAYLLKAHGLIRGDVEELLDWAETYVRPRAKLAFEGKGKQVPGDWCRFCRARTSCKACAEEAMALVREEFLDLDEGVLADEAEETDATAAYNPDTSAPTFKSPALLSKTDIEKMLPTLNRIESWIEAIFAYVSSEAINHGVVWDGYKVVEGRSKRQFLDTKSVVAAAEKAGYTDIYKTELISLTEFEKLMGKKKFKEILGEYVVKPPGKLALVPNSDPREEVDLETAEDEFTPLD